MLCKLCTNFFANQDVFVAHCKEKHLTEDGLPRLTCPFDDCDRQFHIANSFRRHLKSHLDKTTSLCYFIPNEENVVPEEEEAIGKQVSTFLQSVPSEEGCQATETIDPIEENAIDDDVVENYTQ